MVKKTKLRPRRLFYDKSKNKYYYLIEGKKTFIKTGDVSQKQLVKINIKNIVPTSAPSRRRRQPAETTLITSSKKVAPILLAPISANLTPNLNLYKLKDSEKLGEKITSLEKKIEVLSDTTKTTIPKPSTPTPSFPPTLNRSESAKKKGIQMTDDVVDNLISEYTADSFPPKKWFDSRQSDVYADYYLGVSGTKYEKARERWETNKRNEQAKKPAPVEKEAAVNTQVTNVRTMAYILKDSATEGLKGIARALSPKTSKVEPLNTQVTNARTMAGILKDSARLTTTEPTLTTTKDDNPVDDGDINVPAGAPIKRKDDLPIKRKDDLLIKGVKGKGHENDEDGIYNDELEQIFYDKLHKFVPVISSDEMDIIEKMVNKDTKKIGWIQNTDPKKSKGRHWVAYFINVPEGEINYYDSLVENNGMPSAENMKGLKKIIDKINPEFYLKFKNNLCRFQNPKSNNCGYFSLKFLLDRYSNIPFRECTRYNRVVDRYEEGEMMIKKFKRYL